MGSLVFHIKTFLFRIKFLNNLKGNFNIYDTQYLVFFVVNCLFLLLVKCMTFMEVFLYHLHQRSVPQGEHSLTFGGQEFWRALTYR